MKLLMFRNIWVVLFLCLAGCSKLFPPTIPPAPTNVVAYPGDTTVVVEWDMVPGVVYFAYWAPNTTGLTPASCGSNPQCLAATNVTSPYVISSLTDGTPYSVAINGRINGGPGGPGATAQPDPVTPRQAASSNLWTTGSSLGSDLRGLTYGYLYNSAGAALGYGFVATGASGALYYSLDGINWTSISNPLPSTTFYGLANTGSTYVAVGAGGAMLYSASYAESGSWTQQTSVTSNDLYAVYGYGAGLFVAVGQNGTILTSTSGTSSSWTTQTSNTSNSLRSITYGNSLYVAVGDAGTLLTSGDGGTWTVNTTIPSLISSANLNGVTYGYVVSSVTGLATPTFVAVGSNGTVITSVDNGVTWTPQTTQLSSTQLNAVTFGALAVATDGQFVAVDSAANVFTSPDGLTWTNQILTSGSPLYAIVHGQLSTGSYAYSAVGAGGLNMESQ
jgi:photosystem II stability/assembly factor-like uncharacterized protein